MIRTQQVLTQNTSKDELRKIFQNGVHHQVFPQKDACVMASDHTMACWVAPAWSWERIGRRREFLRFNEIIIHAAKFKRSE
jgi:hypothetical protein